MNKFSFGSLLFLSLLGLLACEEEGPYINFNPEITDTSLIDTTYISDMSVTPQQRSVLIEDFTGVRCPNCPNASIKLHEIDSAYNGRLVAVAIHMFDNNFAYPHVLTIDYRTTEGTSIFTLLGSGNLPVGGINRKKYPSETNILVRTDKWLTYFVDNLSETPYCNITLTSRKDSIDTNAYIIKVMIQYTSNVLATNYITLGIKESGMISPQTLPNGTVDSQYIHKNVLRKILTNAGGTLLFENPEENRVILKEYKIKLQNDWNAENCKIFCFVHRNDTEYTVIQADEIKL